jgi:hypothetical protein
MAENPPSPSEAPKPDSPVLEQGTYEILRQRLTTHGAELRSRLGNLNGARHDVFGAIPTSLVATERITTQNNCAPRDMIPLGRNRFIFGYNVHIGLRTEIQLADVFAVYEHRDHHFHELPLDFLKTGDFEADFRSLYKYYKHTVFAQFSLIGPHLFMAFRVGKSVSDIKAFKWLCHDGQLTYLGNRFDHEYKFPPQHGFEWKRTHRELHRSGLYPHVSIEDRVFVECVGGDLTVKVEDNTDSGEGIYAEPVDNPDQTLDDAEIFYASIGNLILLKIRPYQEKKFRFLVFNEKQKQARRIDAIEDACVLLPDDHGIIFSSGYYLQSGEFKQFETALTGLTFYKRIPSPNGEDFLYAFYHQDSGDYILLSYNLISQAVETPLICNGFSLFDNGEMALFKADAEPQKHHVIQVWQTPYVGPAWQPETKKDSYLFKIGNPELVACMAECHTVLNLLGKDDTYANLYLDLVKRTGDIVDSYFWVNRAEAFDLKAPLIEIQNAAKSALAEFDKVLRLRRSTASEVQRVTARAAQITKAIPYAALNEINQFVQSLAQLRAVRGQLISLKELRYADLPLVERVEKEVTSHTEKLSQLTVEFLLKAEALEPYRKRVAELQGEIPGLGKGTAAKQLEEQIAAAARELEMLIEIVSNLKIEDATETTRIVESISVIYSVLNQARAALRQKKKDLQSVEAIAEFASQTRLLNQGVVNYLDLCDAPDKCDDYLNKLMVQVEELEARFADFDEFVTQLAEKRTELSNAFESRKVELIEARNRKASSLFTAAERILKGIKHRVDHLPSINEINGYYAADLMVQKVRDLVQQLIELGDTTKADDLQGRLKIVREEAVRQLKDRQELFVSGENLIQLGRHRFSVNTQELDLTAVKRDAEMFLHLTGTNFFERIEDPEFLATRTAWEQEVLSENALVYRAEYLAYKLFETLRQDGRTEMAARSTDEERLTQVQQFMGPRYAEGYVKGVHDHDAAKLLAALLKMHATIGLLRYAAQARGCAAVFWGQLSEGESKRLLTAKLHGFGTMEQLFPSKETPVSYIRELEQLLREFATRTRLFQDQWIGEASEYLYYQIKEQTEFAVSPEAAELFQGFEKHLHEKRFTDAFQAARKAVEGDFVSTYELLRDWMRGYVSSLQDEEMMDYLDEATSLLWRGSHLRTGLVKAAIVRHIDQLRGGHAVIQEGKYRLHYIRFMRKLRAFESQVVPLFERCQALKKQLVQRARDEMRLEEFKARVLTSFVRNKLIDSVYLPLIGDNLAKQIGVAGEGKRTDLMGMLLLVSPPGYGKTTLMEYTANRLGLVFMKVNGPAIGHRISSLDPAEAPNSAAREEMEKLNLAFEMGDNVMIYLDDIQHLNPEFLQKFISLCDAQRKIEGIFKGRPRTYDLRGRKVAVVMAGNPYTESGEKFKIPDMLSNRADTYNLGDIIGGNAEAFKSSYLENAVTSNPVLNRLASRSQKDIYAIIQLAETSSRDGIELEGNYSPEELTEFVSIMKKLIRVRDVILRVNEEYIRSAAQADAYRTEPPFKLQGSYRNMNRIAEKISSVMNDSELEAVIQQHYKNEAQTLTKDTEANLLKFKELTQSLTAEGLLRWEEIKKTFKKNLLLRGGDERDPVGQVVQQLSAFYDGLDSIKEVLAAGLAQQSKPHSAQPVQPATLILMPAFNEPASSEPSPLVAPPIHVSDGVREVRISQETLRKIWELIEHQPVSDGRRSTTEGGTALNTASDDVVVKVPKDI